MVSSGPDSEPPPPLPRSRIIMPDKEAAAAEAAAETAELKALIASGPPSARRSSHESTPSKLSLSAQKPISTLPGGGSGPAAKPAAASARPKPRLSTEGQPAPSNRKSQLSSRPASSASPMSAPRPQASTGRTAGRDTPSASPMSAPAPQASTGRTTGRDNWAKARGAVKVMGAISRESGKKEKVKKENKLDYLTAEYIREVASSHEKLAVEADAKAKNVVSLSSQLGDLLLQKMEAGMKTKELAKELFEKMDKKGSGKSRRTACRVHAHALHMAFPTLPRSSLPPDPRLTRSQFCNDRNCFRPSRSLRFPWPMQSRRWSSAYQCASSVC